MKMNYLQRSRNPQGNIRQILIAIFVFVVGFLFFSLFKSQTLIVFSPLWDFRNKVVTRTLEIKDFFRTKNSIIEENKNLKDTLAKFESFGLSYDLLAQNNERLLSSLGQIPKEKVIAAGVMARPPQTSYDVLIIDKGKNDGINIGNTAELPFGAIVGSVSSVSDKVSSVTLYTSYGIKTEAVLERDQTPVTLIGEGGGNFQIKIPRSIDIQIGDRILGLGLNPHLIGIVKDVSAESTDAFKSVLASSPQNIFNISEINIVK